MEHRRRHHGGPVLRPSGRAGRTGAEARAVRRRAVERARPDPGAARQAHQLCLARDAARAGPRRRELRDLQAGVRRQDHRHLGALLPQHDAPQRHRALCLHRARIHARARQHARRRHLHGRVQRRAGDVQPFRLSHAGPNLYLAGSPCHPGGAISGGAGYIAAGLIARDLGVSRGGSRGTRADALESLARRRRKAMIGRLPHRGTSANPRP